MLFRRDVAGRIKMEEKLKRLNALLGALRHVNQLIVKEKNRNRLLQGICDTLVKNLGYYNVWISLFDKHGNFISGFESGVGTNFLSLVNQLKSGKLCDCALKAMAQPAVVLTEDPQSCRCCPLTNMYKGRSGLSARLEYAGSIYGLITASTPIYSILYEDERSLFKELADDIAFALYRLELEEERDKATELLQQSEEKFSKVFHNSPIAMSVSRLPDGIWVDVNESFLRLTEYTREEVIGHNSVELNIFEDPPEKRTEIINLLRDKGSISNIEVDARTKSGKHLKLLLSAARVNVGNQEYAISMHVDDTERRKAEEALSMIHGELEERFQERTKELRETTERLQREIADRRKAEKLIENERKRFFDVLEKLPVYLVLLTPDHRVSYANRFFRERFGEDHGRHCFEYLFGRTEPCKNCETYKVLKTMTPLEWEWTGPDGREYYIYDAPFIDVDGSTLILEVGIDITERKKAEKALLKAHDELEMRVMERTRELAEAYEKLRESERDLNRAQAVARIGSWRLDLQNNLLQWSDEVYRIFGIPKETPLTYETFLAAVHPDDHEYVDRKWKAALQGEPYDIEHRIIVNGEVKWVREKAELEFDKVNNVLVSGFGTVQDITERKQAEQALHRAKQEWERTFDAIPDLIAILDDKHRIVRANQALAKKLGKTPEQCVGLPCYKAVHGTEQPLECCPHTKTMKNGQEYIEEIYDERLGGYFLVSTTPLTDEKGQMIGSVHVARNISDLKQLEKKLEEYAKHLEELVEVRTKQLKDSERLAAIGQTAGMVGHDIRNPLQSIEGAVYLAKEELKSLPPESRERKELEEILKIIENQTSYIDHIVSDLQAFAKPPLPRPQETDIQQMINEVLSILKIPPNIQLKITIQKDLKKQFLDPLLLKRILINLTENAIQAMPKGGELTINAFEDEQNLHIYVEDTGEGIAEEDKPKIFTPLFTTKAKGQGFGLAVCKKLIDAHNGEISFESEQGKGTKFKIRLPKRGKTKNGKTKEKHPHNRR